MTTPGFDPSAEQDALTHISQMMVGTKVLQNQPGLVYSLAQQRANPADAQAIDQFLQSLEAEKRVALARASGGAPIPLSESEQEMLTQNGVPFKDVLFTQQDAAKSAAKNVMQSSGGKYTALTNPDGTLALDAQGQIQQVAVHKAVHHDGGGFLGGVGDFFSSIGSGIKDAAVGAMHGMARAADFVQGIARQPGTPSFSDVIHGNVDTGRQWGEDVASNYQDMTDNGYDPTSMWSQLAFDASGKKHSNLTDLNNTYGSDKVDEALQYLNDPNKYQSNIYNDPSNYTTNADGQPELVPDAQAKLRYLQSKEFESLARRVNAQQASVGNDIANGLGIDPVHHATLYTTTAAAANFTAGFIIDPTLAAFRAAHAVKLASVGLDTLGDMKAASILTRRSPFALNVQRGWNRAIDLGKQFRAAAGDVVKQAAVAAKFRAELPGLEPLMENFTGGDRVFQGFHQTETEIVNGKEVPKALYGPSEGIQNLDEAQKFIADKWGLLRLTNGRAATQAGLMPGALSAVGYRKLKGLTAGWMTTRSAVRADKNATELISRAQADPALAAKLLTDKHIANILPESDDAIDFFSGNALGEGFGVTPKGAGFIKQNLKASGDVLGESTLGRFSPTAIAERARQAGIRLSTLLPRNTVIDYNDARSGDILYKTALTYLNRGEANTYRALWNTASAGQRKVMIHGLIDQLGEAAGLGKSTTGQALLTRLKTQQEAYMASGAEIVKNGEHIAPFEGQTRTTWTLPSFQEMQKAANKIGLAEVTMGRGLNTDLADTVMSLWKFGALFKPSTVSRNMLEGWLRTILEGRAGDAMKARVVATMKNQELWDRGYGTADREAFIESRGRVDTLTSELKAGGLTREVRAAKRQELLGHQATVENLSKTSIVKHLLATESGNTALAKEIENGDMFGGQILGRSRTGNWLAQTAPLALVGRAYRHLVGSHIDQETMDALMTYGAHDIQSAMEGYGLQLMEYELGYRNAAKQASETADAGFGPARLRFAFKRNRSRRDGETGDGEQANGTQWTHEALDGTTGVERYAANLARRVNAMPETARSAIALAKLGTESAGRGKATDDLIAALEKESKNTDFGHVYFPDPINAPHIARDAATPEEAAAGKLDWADKVQTEYRYLLTGQNGEFQHELADYITEHGVAPDGSWIADHITRDNRPESALDPHIMAAVPGGTHRLAELLQDVEGTAYQFFVERPLQRTTSAPVFLANYAIARKGLNPMVESMVEGGMKREAAENLAKELATRQSWVKTEQLIDDPGQKTQFDIVARNMFPFARATQAMVRRWATGLWQNPVAARKMMLAYEGAVHSGLIYDNAYGEPTFTYPGSGVMSMALRGLAQVPGFENFGRFPIAGDMTGQVLMSVPGADNPFRMGMGPMISVPFREIYTTLLPYLHAHLGVPTANTQEQLSKLDTLINGSIGSGETWVQFVPTAVRKFYVALDGNQRNSALASAMNGAIANLAAAGRLPSPDASSAEKQQFLAHLQTQVKSQLFLRAVFGLFAPAAPSTPSEATSGSGSDYAFDLSGMQQLDEEYRQILNEVHGDLGRANAIWTTLHPDKVVYDPSGDLKSNFYAGTGSETFDSKSTTPGAYLPPTDSSLQWLDRHADFVKSYNSVAAYFLPTPTANEPFSDAAYRAQLEFGLRQKKTPAEFLKDIYVKHAEAVFYPADKQLNQEIAQARLTGNKPLAAQLTQQRHDWQQQFKLLNPYFGDKLDDYGTARKQARAQLSDLQHMVDQNAVPDGYGPQLSTLLYSYNKYEQFLNDHQGQSNENVAAKAHALDAFNAWADEKLAGTPLASVFNGVFRVLNSNFDKVNGSQ